MSGYGLRTAFDDLRRCQLAVLYLPGEVKSLKHRQRSFASRDGAAVVDIARAGPFRYVRLGPRAEAPR